MNNAIRDIMIASIKPYLKDMKIIVAHKNRIIQNKDISVSVIMGEQTKSFKLDDMIKDLNNGKIKIT